MPRTQPVGELWSFFGNAPSALDRVSSASLDNALGVLVGTMNALIADVGIIQRSDDLLADQVVSMRCLGLDVITALASASGWQPKQPCLCATTGANITLSGEQTIDGQTTNLSRVLVKDQSSPSQNGIYISNPGAWTLAPDANSAASIGYALVGVKQGLQNANTTWVAGAAASTITLGTTTIPFYLVGQPGGTQSISQGGTGQTAPNAWPTSRRLMARVVAVANVNINSPGATLDSVSLSVGDRVLLTAQGGGAQNGLWIFQGSTSTMTRPLDYASGNAAQAFQDLEVPIREGAVYSGSVWRISTAGAITIDSTVTAWALEITPGTISQTFDSMTALKALAPPPGVATVLVRGYYTPGDGGGGVFRWNASDSTTDNGGTVIQPSSAPSTGRWNRVYDYGRINVRWFGAYGDNTHDDTTALNNAAVVAGGGILYLPAPGTYLCSGLTLTNANAGLRIEGSTYFNYNSTTAACIIAKNSSQASVITINSGTNQVVFRGLRIDGNSLALIGVQANNCAFLTMEDCGVYGCLNYGLTCTGGVGRYHRVFFNNSGVGLQIFSDTTVSNSEFTGGTIPLSITAGGCRLENVWANAGSTCCVQLQPLTNSTNHINTSIAGCYFGETISTSGAPIISILQNGSASVSYVQITGGYMVNADTSVNRKIGWLNATGVTGLTITGVQFQGYGTFMDANHITQYWLNLTSCTQVNVTGNVVYGCNANPVLLSGCAQVSINNNQFINWGDGGTAVLTSTQKICITTTATNKMGIGGNLFSVTTGDSVCTALSVDNGNTFYSPGINFIDYPSATISVFTSNPGQLLWTRGNQGPMHLSAFGIVQDTAGLALTVKEGSSAAVQGTATLVGGTVAISFPAATAQSRIYLQVITPGGTQGFLHYSVSAGTGFTVTSSNGADTSTFSYLIVQGS